MEKSPLRLSEGVMVAAAPAYGYLLAYVYQRGFAGELRIPYEFIEVGLRDVLLVTVGALFIMMVVVRPLLDFALALPLPTNERPRRAVVIILVWVAVNATHLAIYRHHLDRVWVLAGTTGLVTIWAVWMTLKSYMPKTSAHHIEDRLGRPTVLSLFALLFAIVLALSLGSARALDQREFLVVPSTNEAILAIYGKTAVLAPHSNGQLRDRFRLADVSGLDLERRRIGPLTPPEEDDT